MLVLLATHSVFAQTQTTSPSSLSSISKPNRVEFSPTISADGRSMIFETQNRDKWELYQSHLTEAGTWTEPIPLETINSKCNFIGGPSLSYDGNTLYYTAFIEGETTSEDIYYSVRTDENTWSEPRPMGAPINSADNYEGFPSISADGKSLYFIRVDPGNGIDKKSKEMCFTIYVTHQRPDGSWGEPEMLPAQINQGCERDPRIMADNHTLIFSSVREEGKGKYDLYQSQLQPDGDWSDPVALDFINSKDNDQAPCISASGNRMFYYSKGDILEVEIPKEFRQFINVTMLGSIRSREGNEPIRASIRVKDNTTNEIFTTQSNPADGKYSLVLAAGGKYTVTVFNPAYAPEKIELDYTGLDTYKEEKRDFFLVNSFSAVIKLKDKDLPAHKIPALLTLTENTGKIIFQDTIRTGEQAVPLITGQAYKISVNAKGYAPMEEWVTFGGDRHRAEKTFIMEHEKVPMSAEVTDISTGDKKRMKVTYKNESTDEVIVADAGEVVNLRKGDRYSVVTNSDKGYAYSVKSIQAGINSPADGPAHLALPIAPLELGAKLTLNHIYFQTNSSTLSEKSALELNTIVQLLQKNPNITIEISAHSDNVGSDSYNLNLSQKRANSVTDYLVKKGIPARQLEAKGYGKSQPVAPNDTPENKAKNRRVEMLVVKIG